MNSMNDSFIAVLENTSDAFFALDSSWQFTYVNRKAEQLFHKARAQLLGHTIWEEFPVLANSLFYEHCQQALSTQKTIHFEEYYVPETHWLAAYIHPFHDGVSVYFHYTEKRSKQPNEYQLLLQQIADERASAKANEERTRLILSHVTEGIIIADSQGNIVQVNEVAAEVHGYSNPRALERNLRDFPDTFELHYMDGRLMPLEEWPLARVLRGEEVKDLELRIRRLSSSTERIFSYNGCLIHDEQGAITMAIITLRDITDHKTAEEHVRISEERFRLLCENAPIGIVITYDRENVYVNQAFVTMMGFDSAEEVMSKSYLEMIAPECHEEIANLLAQRARGENTPLNYEIIAMRKDKSTFPASIDIGIMPIEHHLATITFATDITERRDAERRKDDFLSMASHELRTPITSVKVYTQLLQRMFEKEGKKEPALYLSKMDVQINKLTQLIINLIDVTRMQSDKFALQEEEFDFNVLVKKVVASVQEEASHHSIVVNGAIDTPMWGDKMRLGQALENLLTNAIKYSPQHDTVHIYLSCTSQHLSVRVQDFGIGIPKHQQAKVFDRFYRVYDKNEITYPGLGIGLYVTREIIARHHGTLSVESVEGQGSVFSFTLPLQQQQRTAKVS